MHGNQNQTKKPRIFFLSARDTCKKKREKVKERKKNENVYRYKK